MVSDSCKLYLDKLLSTLENKTTEISFLYDENLPCYDAWNFKNVKHFLEIQKIHTKN